MCVPGVIYKSASMQCKTMWKTFKCSIVKIFEVLEMNPQSVCVFKEGLSLFFNFCKNLVSTLIDCDFVDETTHHFSLLLFL